MASFTDNIPKFNPYIQQLPVEAMVAVGMEKQKRYDEGVQKIQQTIDSVAGLQVTKDSERAYLQSKLNDLTNNLKTFAASDFSDFQLVNSVAGMTKSIASDPIIQTAVSSSMKRQKEIEFMEEARKKGELTPQNEAYFRIRDNEWLNNSELGQSYGARYVPYLDRFKFAEEKFNAMKIDEWKFSDLYKKNSDGSYAVDQFGKLVPSEIIVKNKGYLPGKLKAAIETIFNDPRFKQQLSIDAEYDYRNVSSQELMNSSTDTANELKLQLENNIDTLNLKLLNDPENEEIRKEIENSYQAIEELRSGVLKTAELISSNPNAVKTSLYINKEKLRYTSIFNHSEEKIESNPLWENRFKELQEYNENARFRAKEAREAREFELTYEQQERKMAQEERKNKMNFEIAKLKATRGGRGAGAGEDASESSRYVQSSEDADFNDVTFHKSSVQTAKDNYFNSQIELVWEGLFNISDEPGTKQAEVYAKNQAILEKLGGDKRKALQQIANQKGVTLERYITESTKKLFDQLGDPKLSGNIQKNKPILIKAYQNVIRAEKEKEYQKSIDKKVTEDGLSDFFKSLEKIPFKDKTVKIGNETFEITKEDGIALSVIALYKNKSWITRMLNNDQTEQLSKLAKAYELTLERSGKGRLIKSFLDNGAFTDDFGPSGKSLLSKQEREKLRNSKTLPSELWEKPGVGAWLFGQKEDLTRKRSFAMNPVFDDIYNIMDNIDPSKLTVQIKKQAEAIRKVRGTNPNMVAPMSVGDDGDKVTLATLRAFVTEHSTNSAKMLTGVDQDEFLNEIKKVKNLEDFRKLGIIQGYEKVDDLGKTVPFLQTESGKVYLNKDWAKSFGMDPDTFYESPYVDMVKTNINMYGGKSSVGPVDQKSTYRNNDMVMDNTNFNQLPPNTEYNVGVNFRELNGEYYPYIYINNGKDDKVVPIPISSNNIAKLIMQDLPTYITEKKLEQLLNY